MGLKEATLACLLRSGDTSRDNVAESMQIIEQTIQTVQIYERHTTREEASLIMQSSGKYAEEAKSSCFPPSALVLTTSGKTIRMDQLKPYDELATSSFSRDRERSQHPAKFYTYLHYDPMAFAEFLVLHLSNDQELAITGDHLLFVFSRREQRIEAVLARRIQPGYTITLRGGA